MPEWGIQHWHSRVPVVCCIPGADSCRGTGARLGTGQAPVLSLPAVPPRSATAHLIQDAVHGGHEALVAAPQPLLHGLIPLHGRIPLHGQGRSRRPPLSSAQRDQPLPRRFKPRVTAPLAAFDWLSFKSVLALQPVQVRDGRALNCDWLLKLLCAGSHRLQVLAFGAKPGAVLGRYSTW